VRRGGIPVVVVDFDGTLVERDVGDAICARFADPSWLDWDEKWLRGEVALPDAQLEMWKLVQASADEMRAYAREVGTFRRGADRLFAAARAREIELVLASGGFDLYIEEILGDRAEVFAERWVSKLTVEGRMCLPEFPHWRIEDCDRCGVCKRMLVSRLVAEGRQVAFCGDGSSDRCAAKAAPRLFAVEGEGLSRHCVEYGIPFEPFVDFETVLNAVLDGGRR
jgi:2-hydroxy-3-keto-5-methylthiopentenyl-1-phosphate phosphatase